MDTKEVVQAVDAILKEKKIDKSKLSEIVESLFKAIIKKKYEIEDEEVDQFFSVTFNIENGDVEIIHERIVVEDNELKIPVSQIRLSDALKIDDAAEIGEALPEIINFNDFGRRHILAAKQILVQKIKKEEKHNLFDAFQNRVGEIISAVIQQVSPREVKLQYEDVELILPKNECVFNERYRRGELKRVMVKEVAEKNQDVKIIVSRSDKDFLKKLFELEVPEIADGVVNILHIARKPGLRSKIILETLDPRVDPVGACVGQRGSRISSIVSELNKEKVDIIQHVQDLKIYMTRLLGIKTEYQLDIDEENRTAEIVIADSLVNDVLGFKNANVELTEEITGYKIKVLSDSDFAKQNEIQLLSVEELDKNLVAKLQENGFFTADDVFDADRSALLQIEGMTKEALDSIFTVLNGYYIED